MQNPQTILLVDDDIDDHEFFGMAVSRINESIKILKAENGQQAINLLLDIEQLPDLVFLDLNMPAVDGKQFLRLIKEEPKLADLHVIVYTTSSSEEDVKETLQLGAKHYITKPDNITDIIKTLSAIL